MAHHQPAFRVNFQVVQMIGILLVALAVPLALVALGVRQFTAKPQPAPETGGLRAALEQVAEKTWNVPDAMSDGRGIFVLSSRGNAVQIRETIAKSVGDLHGVVLSAPTAQNQAGRLLVQVPAISAGSFEDRSGGAGKRPGSAGCVGAARYTGWRGG